MFSRKEFSRMKRAGFPVISASKSKIAEVMLDILEQLPKGTKNLKKVVEQNLGMAAQTISSRDMNDLWDKTKRKAARQFPDKFYLDGRNALKWKETSEIELDKNISLTNYKKLNELANVENCSVNAMISKLIKGWGKNST
jgi:hypothetical protein